MKPSTQALASPFRNRSTWWWALIALAVLLVAGGGWAAWKRWGSGARPDSNYILTTVQRGDIEDQVSATGSLQPRNYVDVGAQVSGLLRKLIVDVGSEVREGDLLAEIDAETSIAKVDASRAQLRSQEAQMVEREIALTKAERDLQRQKNLMAEEATTVETLQNAETTLRTARAQIQSLKAQMEQLRASMRVDEANLKFTKIYAPMAGTVVSITARQGQTLNANQAAPTLLRVADLSVMQVQTQVSEADVSKLRLNMPVYFTTLGGQGRRWYGQLKKIEPTPTVTNNVVLYNALFEVPNSQRNLMTQMTAQVFFVVAEARDVLMVPMSALNIQRGAAGARDQRGPRGNTPGAPGARPAGQSGAVVSDGGIVLVADGPADARPRMSREAFQNLSEEERQRLRDQRRREREQTGAEGAPAPAAAASAPRRAGAASAPSQRAQRNPREAATAVPPAAALPAEPPRPVRGPRQAKVKVMGEDGVIEEREITIGISNRVHAEVLAGLKEGERVIAGTRDAEPQRRPQQGQQPAGMGGQNFGAPPGTPGGPPATGGARR